MNRYVFKISSISYGNSITINKTANDNGNETKLQQDERRLTGLLSAD